MQLSTEQLAAIELCCDLSKRIVSVTGQAGTGKTTILEETVSELLERNASLSREDIVLCAFTGKAAKRIEQATGLEAMTIHRMMRFIRPEDEEEISLPKHDKSNPLPYKVIFTDEASMVANELYRQVIDAMSRGSVIRFFGDINQLPPIESKEYYGKPSPFAVALERFPSVILTHNYRSDDGIIQVSDAVIKNRIPKSNEQVGIYRTSSGDTANQLQKLLKETDFKSLDNQIIAPTKITMHGCDNINNMLQRLLNSNEQKYPIFYNDRQTGKTLARNFKVGDKIIWDRNDYEIGIMNGAQGHIIDWDSETGTVYLDMDGQDFEIPSSVTVFNPFTGMKTTYDPRQAMLLAYAVTTHKAQGSQYDTVVYMCSRSRAATRQNVYTAVTRAKSRLIIFNINGSLSNAINTVAR